MVTLKITNEYIEVRGHMDSKNCYMLSCLVQYICSNLSLRSYTALSGYLKAEYNADDMSDKLIASLESFIRDLKSQKILFIDERRKNETYNKCFSL